MKLKERENSTETKGIMCEIRVYGKWEVDKYACQNW